MNESEFPEVPETAAQLIVRWAQRDAEYAKQRTPLDSNVIASIRWARKSEAGRLPVGDRARMWRRAETWTPPVNSEFGSIRDWLEE